MGYSTDERSTYWGDVKETQHNANSKQCVIWTTDNNGPISQQKGGNNNGTIGPWTYADISEKKWAKTSQILRKYAMRTRGR